MECPVCKQSLAGLDYAGVHIETCAACGGDWLDAEELTSILHARQERFTAEECMAIAKAARIRGVPVAASERHLACPKCGAGMRVENYGDDTGVMIDKCAACGGIWMDKGELDKIDELVQGWDDGLPEDMKEFGPRMRQVAEEVDQKEFVHISHFRRIDAMINGVLDMLGE